MEATGLVDVGFPFWYSLQWRVTVPCAASASTVLPSGAIRTEVIRPREPYLWGGRQNYKLQSATENTSLTWIEDSIEIRNSTAFCKPTQRSLWILRDCQGHTLSCPRHGPLHSAPNNYPSVVTFSCYSVFMYCINTCTTSYTYCITSYTPPRAS